jgi:YidC/Oxa1 family membrane protein insertase
LKKLQNKYKGKTDRDSREKFAREQMDLYKRTGSNPLSSCLPLLLQMPIFMGLFFVINDAQNNRAGVGLLNAELAESFREASFLSAKLSATFISTFDESFEGESVWAVRILAAVMVVLMSASQFITQKQIMAKNQNPDTQNSQFMQTQKILLYVLPFVFLISGVSFPLALVTYWLSSNIWTMGQQFIVIRSMPTPGSIAYKERQDRLAKKGKLKIEEGTTEEEAEPEKPVGQRPQPKKKPKRKKKK